MDLDTIGLECGGHKPHRVRILARQQAIGPRNDPDLSAEPGKCLPQLTADGPTAKDGEPPWQAIDIPDGLAGQRTCIGKARDIRQFWGAPVAMMA